MASTDRGRHADRPPASSRRDSADEEYTEDYDDEELEEGEEEYPELSPADAVRAASDYISALTGKELCGVVSLERDDDGWQIDVEVVEDRRVPSSNDVLGLYSTHLTADGSLSTYRRSRRYLRGRGDQQDAR
jgi:hypothetical protein